MGGSDVPNWPSAFLSESHSQGGLNTISASMIFLLPFLTSIQDPIWRQNPNRGPHKLELIEIRRQFKGETEKRTKGETKKKKKGKIIKASDILRRPWEAMEVMGSLPFPLSIC